MSGATLCANGIHKSDLWVERDSPGSLKGTPLLCCPLLFFMPYAKL